MLSSLGGGIPVGPCGPQALGYAVDRKLNIIPPKQSTKIGF